MSSLRKSIKMSIENYNFKKYNQELVDHLARHLQGSQTTGSHFMKKSFPTAKSLIDFAYEHLQEYNGNKLVKSVDAGKTIGYDSLISLDNLPESATISQEPRGRDGYLANMVRGVEKQPTNKMIIIAGPINEINHGFYTIYPGEIAPPFPVDKDKLVEMKYSGKELIDQIELNQSYEDFWNNHGFVVEDK